MSSFSIHTSPAPAVPRPVKARRIAYVAAFVTVLGLTVWSAVLTKQSRRAIPLGEFTYVAVGEPTLPGERLAGVVEVSDEPPAAPPDPVTAFVGPLPLLTRHPAPALSEEMQVLCADPAVRWFNGRPVKPWKTLTMTVTAYSPDARSCGLSADGLTATLHSVSTNNAQLVAADPRLLPYGSMLSVPGYASNAIVPVLDCGGAIKGNHIDLLFPTHEQARAWGVKKMKIIVWHYVDGKPLDNPRKLR